MTTFELSVTPIKEVTFYKSGGSSISLLFDLTGDNEALPRERFEATKLDEVKRNLAAYAERARATGKPLYASVRVRTGRKPNGWDKANKANELEARVNVEQVIRHADY